MRKIYIAGVALVLAVCLGALAWITSLIYDVSPIDYLKYSIPLTQSEQEYLRQRGELVCGSDLYAPPISFINGDSGQVQGLIVDYMSALSIELNINIRPRLYVWDKAVSELKDGGIDMLDMFSSEERASDFAFTQPIYMLRGTIAVRKGDHGIEGPSDLYGKRVAVPNGDYVMEYLESQPEEKENAVRFVPVAGIPEALNLLSAGKVDAVAGDETVIEYCLKEMTNPTAIEVLEKPIYERDVTLGVDQENELLLSILNKGILELKKKDILIKIQQNWFGTSSLIVKNNASYRWGYQVVLLFGAIVTLFMIWQGLLRRKITEKAGELARSQQDLRTIIDGLAVYLMVVDAGQRIVECNLALERLLDTCRTELIGSRICEHSILNEIVCETDLERSFSEAERAERMEGKTVECRQRYFSVGFAVLDQSQRRTLVSIEDVTEKVVGERRLRQESKMVALGQLSAGLAHEIRNPLGLIKNYMFIMKKYMTDDMGKHAFEVIDNSIGRINGLIDNLLSISRSDSDQLRKTDVEKLVRVILGLAEEQMKKFHIRGIVEVEWDQIVELDQEALKVVLINLVDNAVYALREPSDRPKEIRVTITGDDRQFMIRFADNGCGMNAEQLENLFNAFYTTKEPGEGTGLGLYVVGLEMEKLSGTIRVKSQVGRGTIFEIGIPLEPGDEERRE